MGEHTEAGPDQPTNRRRRGLAIALAVVVSGLTLVVFSPWTPLPHVAMVLDGCDQEALSAELDELEADLVEEHPTLLERGIDDHERVAEAIIDACRMPPHHVHENLRVYVYLMDMASPYEAGPRPVSWLARHQFRRELAWHCGSDDLMSEVGALPPDRSFEVAQERCDLPIKMLGYSIALYYYLVEAGVDEPTSLRALEHFFGSPKTVPIYDEAFAARFPTAAVCTHPRTAAIVVRLNAEAAELPTHPPWPIGAHGLSPGDLEAFRSTLHAEVDRELSGRDRDDDVQVLLFAQDETPLSAIEHVVGAVPDGLIYPPSLAARAVERESHDPPLTFLPLDHTYEKITSDPERRTGLRTATDLVQMLAADENLDCLR